MMSSLVNARSVPTARQCAILRPVDGSAITAPIALNRPVCVVGDRSRVHLVLPSPLVSRSHALVVDDADGLYVRDLASSNGVLVNESRVRETLLQDGDRLRIGPFAFKCRVPRPIPDDGHEPVAAEIRGDDIAPVPLNGRRSTLIGSRGACDVRLRGVGVSPVHAVIFRRRGRWFIRDLSSEGGTRIFGRLIRESELLGGEQIRIGTAAVWYIRPDLEQVAPADATPQATAAETLDVMLLDDAPAIEIGPDESGFSPLPATGENWTRSEGFDTGQVTADDLGLDASENSGPTALASASNLLSADPEQTLVDASRSVLTLADLIDTPMTADDLGLADEPFVERAAPAAEQGQAGVPSASRPKPASRAAPRDPADRPPRARSRPAPIDAGAVFDHEMFGSPEESGSLPEFSALLGIDSALADMGLGDDGPRARSARAQVGPPETLLSEIAPVDSSPVEPVPVEALPLRELTFAPLVAGWAKCPGCGTAFPLHTRG